MARLRHRSGVYRAFLGDTAANVYSGVPSVTSTGSAVTANVAGSPYTITAAAGGLSLLNGYAADFDNADV